MNIGSILMELMIKLQQINKSIKLQLNHLFNVHLMVLEFLALPMAKLEVVKLILCLGTAKKYMDYIYWLHVISSNKLFKKMDFKFGYHFMRYIVENFLIY